MQGKSDVVSNPKNFLTLIVQSTLTLYQPYIQNYKSLVWPQANL